MRPRRLGVLFVSSSAVVATMLAFGAPREPAPDRVPLPQADRGDPCPTVPGEVGGVLWTSPSTIGWDPDACASTFNVYRGKLSLSGRPAQCHGSDIPGTSFDTPADPDSSEAFFYLVTAEAVEEGGPGTTSGGAPRELLGRCDTVLRNHLLDRVAYGWNEWSRDALAALGPQGFVDEQLDPASIDEATNTTLAARLLAIEPPETLPELQAVDVVKAVYARRQLEQSATLFWVNHFNTEWRKTRMYFGFFSSDPDRRDRETAKLHYDEMETFRDVAFNGTFRDILGASAYSPAMIIYLDTRSNVAANPNENYARELLELHTMGVDGGYDQNDVEELARVFTGWEVCRKADADVEDPLAPCINPLLDGGAVVAHFNAANHDCGPKVLFPDDLDNRIDIPSTCDSPDFGVNDAALALDGLAAHPSTKAFISEKLLEKYVTEEPTQAQVDAVVAAWSDVGNPAGVGDLREVMRAVLDPARLSDPDLARNKIKTPFEHAASVLRATRGDTNGNRGIRGYLRRMQHRLHENAVPTGYPESGSEWIDTNNTLERQNLGTSVSTGTHPDFGSNLIALLNDNGVFTAPGNAEAIVDFLSDVFFGGALAPGERQQALEFLNTNDSGVPSDYDDARIRDTAGFMLGFGQFQEQ